ncbi:hypothetical protein [Streptomyces syringium]
MVAGPWQTDPWWWDDTGCAGGVPCALLPASTVHGDWDEPPP